MRQNVDHYKTKNKHECSMVMYKNGEYDPITGKVISGEIIKETKLKETDKK